MRELHVRNEEPRCCLVPPVKSCAACKLPASCVPFLPCKQASCNNMQQIVVSAGASLHKLLHPCILTVNPTGSVNPCTSQVTVMQTTLCWASTLALMALPLWPPNQSLAGNNLPAQAAKAGLFKLRVQGDPRPSSMGTVLHSLHTQVGQSLTSLHLDLQHSWAGAAQVWGKLGNLPYVVWHTGLTRLVLDVGEKVSYGGCWDMRHNA